MSKEGLSRRTFMKTAGVTAGVAVAVGYNPLSYAANEKIRVGAIGTGGQGSFHLRDGLARAHNLDVVAVCDVYEPHQAGGWEQAGGKTRKVNRYFEYKEMIEKENLDAVVIATPLHTHYQIAADCLDSGLYCFCEKTMCYSIEQARDLVQRAHNKGLFVQVGHQRRYNPTYNHALKLAWEGDGDIKGILGRINHVDCQWHRNNEWRRPVEQHELSDIEKKYIKDLERHLNWRLYHDTSGGLMTELATHALDVVNWYLDANPTRVVGYGGIDYWRDGREAYDNVNVIYDYEITPESRAFWPIEPRIKEQESVGDALNAPYTVRVVYSSITANAKRGASETFQGDQGTFELSELGSFYYAEPTATVKWGEEGVKAEEANAVKITTGGTLQLSNERLKNAKPMTVDSDKSVDQIQFEAFARDIKNGGIPRANAMVGLKSTVCAVTGLQAMIEGREIKIDPNWYKFDGWTEEDYKANDTSMYGPVEA